MADTSDKVTDDDSPVDDLETYTETIEYLYTDIGGESIRVATAIDFLDLVQGTTSFNSLRWNQNYSTVAEAFIEEGLVGTTNSGSWFSRNDEAIEKVKEELTEHYYNNTN